MLERLSDDLGALFAGLAGRVDRLLEGVEHDALPLMREAWADLRAGAGELTELSAERGRELLAVLRDREAGFVEALRDDEGQLKQWLALDWQWIEQQLSELVDQSADPTVRALEDLELAAALAGVARTGQTHADGLYRCVQCEHALHLHEGKRVPPCPACHHSVFRRVESPSS